MSSIFAYYGVDWFAMALSLYAAYLLGNKQKLGYIVFAVSNIIGLF